VTSCRRTNCILHRRKGCSRLARGGQPEKGVILSNRWARFAGYAPIALISRSPLVIDIGDAVMQVQDYSFKVVKVRRLDVGPAS
jgi:hypothetical protein